MLLFIFGEVKSTWERYLLVYLFFFSIILFCSLGTWQVYRLQWKLELISEINNGLNSDPVFYSNTNVINYQKVKFDGIFDFEKQIYLYSLDSKGTPGFDIVTPIKMNSNEILLVNRGWIRKESENQ